MDGTSVVGGRKLYASHMSVLHAVTLADHVEDILNRVRRREQALGPRDTSPPDANMMQQATGHLHIDLL